MCNKKILINVEDYPEDKKRIMFDWFDIVGDHPYSDDHDVIYFRNEPSLSYWNFGDLKCKIGLECIKDYEEIILSEVTKGDVEVYKMLYDLDLSDLLEKIND